MTCLLCDIAYMLDLDTCLTAEAKTWTDRNCSPQLRVWYGSGPTIYRYVQQYIYSYNPSQNVARCVAPQWSMPGVRPLRAAASRRTKRNFASAGRSVARPRRPQSALVLYERFLSYADVRQNANNIHIYIETYIYIYIFERCDATYAMYLYISAASLGEKSQKT